MSAHVKQQKTDLEHVDIKRSHRPRVLVFLGDDDLGVSSYDFGWVIQNDVPVLSPGDQDSRDSLACSHAVRPPDQLVVPARQTPTGYSHRLPASRTPFYSAGCSLAGNLCYMWPTICTRERKISGAIQKFQVLFLVGAPGRANFPLLCWMLSQWLAHIRHVSLGLQSSFQAELEELNTLQEMFSNRCVHPQKKKKEITSARTC